MNAMRHLALASLLFGLFPLHLPIYADSAAKASRTITWADLRFPTSQPKKVMIEGATSEVESFADQIPEAIRSLDGATIEIRGYMMPVELEGTRVRAFVLVVSQQVCCFGATPDINEYIIARVTGKPAPLL